MEIVRELGPDDPVGTTISFLPDAEIFEELDAEAATITQRLRETAFLTRGLYIKLTDERADGKTVEFHYEGGIRDFVSYINESKDPIHKHIVYFEGETDQGSVEVAMQWNNSYQESVFTFANNINTRRGRLAPLRIPQRAHADAQHEGAGPEAAEEGRDARGRGRPRGPRGGRLGEAAQPAVRGPDEDEARQPRRSRASSRRRSTPTSREFFEENPQDARAICNKAIAAMRARHGGAQGARADAAQVGARQLVAARQARRLLDPRPGGRRAVHRRGRLRRRLREDGPRPHLPGDPAAAREDHQQREEPDQQGSLEQRDPGDDHRDRHRDRRRVRHRRGCATTGSS